MKSLCLSLFILLMLSSCALAEESITIVVAPDGNDRAEETLENPVATLEHALSRVRKRRAQFSQPPAARIVLRQGIYRPSKPLRLRPQDSNLTITAGTNEQPIIHGGKTITGWRVQADGSWQTTLDAVKTGTWTFQQLYVDGIRRPRARTPNTGFYRVAGFPDGKPPEVGYHHDCQRFEYRPGDIDPNWTNLEDVEVVVYHFWTDSHLPIQSIDTTTHIVTFKHKAGKVFTDDFNDEGARYVVRNVYKALDDPGEWYLNQKTGVLTYLPLPGETPETVNVTAPVLPSFIHLEGDPLNRRYVENVRIQGLSFKYSNWQLPPGNSNDGQGSSSVPAAITLRGARNCQLNQCTLVNLATFAIELNEGCSENTISNNTLAYIAAGGCRVNGGTENDHPLLRTGHNIISDNHLHHFGEVYPSAVGVLLQHTAGNRVEHNHIHHGYYTGISVGWEWGYQRSVSRHNRIAYNHIHHIGQGLLSDMGGIYTLGVSPGTVIRNNLIHDVDANHYGGWGIYNDEGSTHHLIRDNIVYNTKFSTYNIHYAKEVTVRNNIFAQARINQLSRKWLEPHKSVYFENNIIYWTEGELLRGDWGKKPYEFYFNPFKKNHIRTLERHEEMDWNVYYHPGMPADSIRFDGRTFKEWQASGRDQHSVIANPLFVDPDNHDYRLRPESPALDLGFQPIDMSTVGPRPVDDNPHQKRD